MHALMSAFRLMRTSARHTGSLLSPIRNRCYAVMLIEAE